MIQDLTEQHRQALEENIFTTPDGKIPPWLAQQARRCSERYQGFRMIPEFRAALNAFSDDSFKPFELFVLGEGKFGKSTLVNALLGEVRSKSRGLPETRCFLRYVITDKPRSTSRMFLRIKPGTHDWIAREVGQGKKVPELFEMLEYEVEASVAKEILDEESRRLDGGNYSPAVYEAERDHKKTNRCIFPAGVRIVDTQGLDQLFPDDLQQLGRNSEDPDITKRFLDWMSSTPRGKHLEWQFRRCDAVLWCVNAKRIGSAATEASMKYFSSYSKKIVIALTNIDLVVRKESDMERLLEKARQKYGHFAKILVPVNGQLALESALAEDSDGLHSSGLIELAEALTRVCVSDATKTRAVSRYIGLRQTETQFRSALAQLGTELADIVRKYRSDCDLTDKERNRSIAIFEKWLGPIIEKESIAALEKVQYIDLSDDRYTSLEKMGVSSMTASIQSQVEVYFRQHIVPEILRTAGQIKPYRLPLFDADGERCGDLCAIDVELSKPALPALNLWLNLRLEDEVFTRAALWLRKKVLGFFSERAKQEALVEERNLIIERQKYVFDVFIFQWEKCYIEWVKQLFQQTHEMYNPIFDELDQIIEKISSVEEESIESTIRRIDMALIDRASKAAFHERFLAIFKSGGRLGLGAAI